MVRMGDEMTDRAQSFLASAVDASEELAEKLKAKFRVDVDGDVSEVANMLAKQVKQETFRAANGAKFERELDEKYGMLKDVILHPTVQWILGCCAQFWNSFHLFGRPPLGTTAGVIVGLMIYRRKIGFVNMLLTAAVLSGLNPLVVLVGVLVWKLWASTRHIPRGCGKVRPEYEPPEDLGEDKLCDEFMPSKIELFSEPDGGGIGSAAGGGEREKTHYYDHIVVGSDLGGLYCAALLARCGRRVLVLEQGPLAGAGAVVKAPNTGETDWEFETGIQCLGGGEKLGRFVKRLSVAFLPGTETLQWEQVGKLESELKVYDMVSIGDGKQQIVFPSGEEKLLEVLGEQFPERRTFFQGLASQAQTTTKIGMAFYLGKVFAARPDRWLDRVLKAMFVDSTAKAYIAVATRSVKDMMRAMITVEQPENAEDLRGAQAAMCALFRRENLTPPRLSCAALMAHMCGTWGGLFHPRGGFRAIAERLVDAIHASGGRVLTHARVTSALVESDRATGVSVTSTVSSSKSLSGGCSAPLEVRVTKRGSVISAIGILDTFHQLVPLPPPPDLPPKKSSADGGGGAKAGEEGAGGEAVGGGGMGKGKRGLEPAGYRNLRAARPRVHLCVGLQGNWMEDLEGVGAYFHHVRDSTGDDDGSHYDRLANGDGAGGAGDREWYRISFGEAKDSEKWKKTTTTCVVTSEMSREMAKMVIDNAGSANKPIGPLYYSVQTGKSARDRMRDAMLRRLHEQFPLTEGRDEFVMLVEEPRAGLSHGPERYVAEGLCSPTNLPGLFLCGEDLTLGGMEGAIQGGWIAAHAVLGYTPVDLLLRTRSLASDIPNLDRLQGYK